MTRRIAKIFAVTIVLGFGLETSFAPTLMPGMTSEALARGGGGGHGGGGHGGGHFGGGHFGGGHFGGGHFGGRHFGGGHFGGRHFGGRHFGGKHFGGRYFGGRHFARGHFGRGQLAGHRFAGAGHRGSRMAFAHAGFGDRFNGFNGGHGFRPHGFNRNAFGTMAGWNNWGSGWGYWAGPVFWPFFFGDVLTFALWPYAYYDPFFTYGPDFLLISIFWPGPLLWPYYAYDPYYEQTYGPFDIYGYAPSVNDYANYGRYRGRRNHLHYAGRTLARPDLETASNTALTCGGLAPGLANVPVDQIESAIRPSNAQVALLNDLKAASAQADRILRSSCPTEVSLTPIGRLDTVASRIQAMIQAVQILRPPVTALYNSLDDEQKGRFAAIGLQRENRRVRATREGSSPAGTLGGLCQQQTGEFTLLPVQRIEDTVKPTEQQKAAFDDLKSASTKAATDLDTSCPADMPETLTARLDAVAKRLDALADAVNTVKPALTDFYNTLTDEQKARFNVIHASHASATL
jgi:hypothetical protein